MVAEMMPPQGTVMYSGPDDTRQNGGLLTTDDAPYCYYRQPNGWITTGLWGKQGQEFPIQEIKYEREGWKSLREQYGVFQMSTYMLDHEMEVLIMRGGVLEIPKDQIIAHGWDHSPFKVPICGTATGRQHLATFGKALHTPRCWNQANLVQWPQLVGHVASKPEPCPFCDDSVSPTDAARQQHIRAMHKEQLAQLEQSKQIADALRTSLGAVANPMPFVCGLCKEGFATVDDMLEHITLHAGDDGAPVAKGKSAKSGA